MSNIQTAIIINTDDKSKKQIEESATKAGMTVVFYRSLSEVSKSERHDVYVIESGIAKQASVQMFDTSSLILVQKQQEPITGLYEMAKKFGAYSIISMPFKTDELISTIQSAYEALLGDKAETTEEHKHGKSVAITSFKSGDGKSLISYNLARTISNYFAGNEVNLVDCNFPFSVSKAMIDVESQHTWDTIRPLLKDGEIVGRNRLFSLLKMTPYRFYLTPGPSSYEQNAPLQKNEMQTLIQSLQKYFAVSVFDLPAIGTKEDIEKLVPFDHVIFVISNESADLLSAKTGIEYIRKHHEDLFAKSHVVLNRMNSAKPELIEGIKSRLNIQTLGKIEDDPEAVQNFTSLGKLFTDEKLVITQDFNNLGEKLFKTLF